MGLIPLTSGPTGEVVRLARENEYFSNVIWPRVSPGLSIGFGGVNYNAIQFVFSLLQIPGGEQPVIFDKILAVTAAINEIREAERRHG
ncbi:MAG: hypothetical protein JRJ86_23900 [Deltaproteobacteria bacterium]|nr:hypothetical protein [Deltaproteobacteria bacterium]